MPAWHMRIPPHVFDDEELDTEYEDYPLLPEWMFQDAHLQNVENPLNYGMELDNDEGYSWHNLFDEDDIALHSELEILSTLPHNYCNVPNCETHGAFFKSNDSRYLIVLTLACAKLCILNIVTLILLCCDNAFVFLLMQLSMG